MHCHIDISKMASLSVKRSIIDNYGLTDKLHQYLTETTSLWLEQCNIASTTFTENDVTEPTEYTRNSINFIYYNLNE